MFTPSQADVRKFFCDVYARQRGGLPLDALQTLAGQWIAEHPEYHADLADVTPVSYTHLTLPTILRV